MKFSFPDSLRLKRRADFAALRSGRRIHGRFFVLVYRENDLGFPRLGLAVSRKFGNAVRRNRLKRVVREQFRLNRHRLPACDMLIIPKKTKSPSTDPAAELQLLFDRLCAQVRSR